MSNNNNNNGSIAFVQLRSIEQAVECLETYRQDAKVVAGATVPTIMFAGYAERVDTLADMRGSAWYRTEMIRVWVRRAIERAR